MTKPIYHRLHRPVTAALALAAAAAFTAPAAAQTYYDDSYSTVEPLVVYGPAYRYRDDVQRMSRVVNLRDLDLTTYEGQRVMEWRVRQTARDICRDLGESRFGDSLSRGSCETRAVRDARPQMRVAVNTAFAVRNAYAYSDLRSPYAPVY
jgi:UrcA family protein